MQMPRVGRPSPALVISLIAVFVALGGTGYAAFAVPKNSVGTKQLKKGAVTGAKIKNGSITGANFNLSKLGTVPSATNATYATSASIAKLTYVVTSTTVPSIMQNQDESASCPAGTNVVGGGVRLGDTTDDYINDSGPNGRTGWISNVHSTSSPSTTQSVTVTAICAPAAATAP
jgi:hypothetical protein